jgi:hypothetical protein
MFKIDTNDLLTRIQAGENPEDIANEFAKQLNDVVELDRKQKAAELALQKEKEEKAAREKNLDAKAQVILTALIDYVTELDPALAAEFAEEDEELFDVKSIRSMLDAAIAGVKLSLSIAQTLENETAAKPDPKAAKTSDDAISQFLKNFGL